MELIAKTMMDVGCVRRGMQRLLPDVYTHAGMWAVYPNGDVVTTRRARAIVLDVLYRVEDLSRLERNLSSEKSV